MKIVNASSNHSCSLDTDIRGHLSYTDRSPMEAASMGCVQLILMIVGIIYLIRRPKYARLSHEDYPHLPEEVFHRWRRLEVISVDIFLVATWGVFIISAIHLVLVFQEYGTFAYALENTWVSQLVFSGIFLVGIIISAIFGSMAAGIRRREGIDSPLYKQHYARPPKGAARDHLPPLIEMLKDKDDRVRELTIEKLAEMGSTAKRALPALRNVVKYDQNENIRTAAEDAIIKIYTGR